MSKRNRVLAVSGNAENRARMAGYLATLLLAAMIFFIAGVGSIRAEAKDLPDFADLVDKHGPAVVNVSTKARVGSQRAGGNPQLENDDLNEFFRRFLPPDAQPRQNPQTPNTPRRNTPAPRTNPDQEPPLRDYGQGSGFIMSADGFVITNAHVVAKADEVTVTLTDKREFKAKVIGSDERTDIAVLKIDATGLPKVNIGDSDKVRVGEWVLAIGSPFGFENTVTAGIVSAKSRESREALTPFIQTDVAVNPGNSGGPLFNLKGEVVGVNSQIFSGTGGYLGISFAIPVNIAMNTANQLIKNGKINRGRIAVVISAVGKDLAESLGLPNDKGALVQDVEKDGPAEKGGMLPQDIIQKINGKVMDSNSDVVRTVAAIAPGTKITATVWRKGAIRDLTITVGETPAPEGKVKASSKKTPDKKDAKPNKIGLTTSDLDAEERKELKVEFGVLVNDVEGAAARAGIQAGDVILGYNTTDIKTSAQLNDLAAKIGSKSIALLVKREGLTRYVVVKPDSK